jgi:3'-phosphoadenosine 5'-phosphosulfate synthase
MLLNETR